MKNLSIAFVIFFFYTVSAKEPQPRRVEEEIQLQTQKFRTILETAYKNHADSVDIEKMSQTAFNAMLKNLDPYSVYYTNQQYKGVAESNEGSTEGTGLNIISLNDTITVTSIIPGSPAAASGVWAGDRILFVNGENTFKKTADEVTDKLNGKEGSFVTIILKRGNSPSLQEHKLARKKYPMTSISSDFIINGTDIGFIKMNRFSHVSDKEFAEAADQLKKNGMKKLVFDLRGNQGGYVDEACNIADQFIRGGKKITYISGKDSVYYRHYISKDGQALEDIPVIVLIDAQTASASEIIAGALQDLDRGIVVGEISRGKGLVQKYWEFKDSSAIKLTVARYFTPSGRCIQKPYKNEASGLDPALKLAMDEKAFRALEEQVKRTGGRKNMDVFRTEKGRPIIGGGGIVPDWFVKDDSTSLLTQVLKSKGVFLSYTYSYLDINREDVVRQYNDKPDMFASGFEVTDSMLSDFSVMAKSRNVWNEKMYTSDKEYIKTFIKASIAHAIWGNPGYYAVMIQCDQPVMRAMELFPEALKFIQ